MPRPIAGSSNGRTPDSGSGSQGSSPCPAALEGPLPKRAFASLDLTAESAQRAVQSLCNPDKSLTYRAALSALSPRSKTAATSDTTSSDTTPAMSWSSSITCAPTCHSTRANAFFLSPRKPITIQASPTVNCHNASPNATASVIRVKRDRRMRLRALVTTRTIGETRCPHNGLDRRWGCRWWRWNQLRARQTAREGKGLTHRLDRIASPRASARGPGPRTFTTSRGAIRAGQLHRRHCGRSFHELRLPGPAKTSNVFLSLEKKKLLRRGKVRGLWRITPKGVASAENSLSGIELAELSAEAAVGGSRLGGAPHAVLPPVQTRPGQVLRIRSQAAPTITCY
jgi:hypothetical protein